MTLTREVPLQTDQSALLFIDVQNFSAHRDGAEFEGLEPNEFAKNYGWFFEQLDACVIPNMQTIQSACRKAQVEVMYTTIESLTLDGRDRSLDYKITGFNVPKGSWDGKVIDQIAPQDDEIVLPKSSSSVFVSTHIDYVLRNLGVRQLVLSGLITDQCVESAIRDACDLGYLVTQVTDACLTYTQERHDASLRAIKGYCRQLTTAQLVEELQDGGMTGTAAITLVTHPARLAVANWVRTVTCMVLLIVVVAGLTLIFGRAGERIAVQMCVNVSAVVALGLFCGNTGIVSFGHGSFMTIGAYLSGILTMPAVLQRSALPKLPEFLAGHELSVWNALPIVAVTGLMFAALTGSAVARLAGASATIATLGLLIITHSVAIGAREITRGSQTFFGVPRVTDLAMALGAALAFILIARLFRESRNGLFARAARDDPEAAAALGINPRRTRFVAWCLSGTLATIAGALYGHMLGAFSPASFYLSLAFAHVAMMIVGGMASVGGAVTGVMAVTLLQDTVRQFEGGAEVLGIAMPEVFGLTTVALGLAILLIIWLRPQGLAGSLELGPGADSKLVHGVTASTKPAPVPEPVASAKLKIEGLSKSFAGIKAVSEARFEVPTGRITGLIGPNGAGKSTLVNLLSCQYDADAGKALFAGSDLTHIVREKVSRLGLSRSFQNLRLFRALTAYENVLVGAMAKGHSRRDAEAVAVRELGDFELGTLAGSTADALPYGARKRLEVARSFAQEPSILMLDEPAAGMNPSETDDLADRLQRAGEARGLGILLIDHDLRFVNRLSKWIVVMNRGRVIAQGTPDEIRSNPAVIEAYIGRGRTAADAQFNSAKPLKPMEGVET